MIKRRSALLAALALSACGQTSVNAIAVDAALIDSGVQTVLAGMRLVNVVSPADLVRAAALAEQIHTAALAVAADTAGVSTAPVARQIINMVQTLEPFVAQAFPPKSGYTVLMTAAVALLPALAMAFGAPMAVTPGKTGPTMSQEDARIILRRGR